MSVFTWFFWLHFPQEILTSVLGFLSENRAHFAWLPQQTRVSLMLKKESYFLSLVWTECLRGQNDNMYWAGRGNLWPRGLQSIKESTHGCETIKVTRTKMKTVSDFNWGGWPWPQQYVDQKNCIWQQDDIEHFTLLGCLGFLKRKQTGTKQQNCLQLY